MKVALLLRRVKRPHTPLSQKRPNGFWAWKNQKSWLILGISLMIMIKMNGVAPFFEPPMGERRD
jgi:hypothetical protein